MLRGGSGRFPMAGDLLIKDCRILDGPAGLSHVLIRRGRIERAGRLTAEPRDVEVLDAHGLWVMPGFVDLHLQGAGGADVIDGTQEAL